MELIKELSKIIAGLEIENKHSVVAICGAADLGKTHLATNLVNSLRKIGISANHITLDSYLMARNKRIESGVSGYDVEAYDLAAIEKDLYNFVKGLPIKICTYDHAKGIAEGPKKTILPCSVLFFDGLHAMHERFESLIKYSIFVCTNDDQLQKIRHRSDIKKRKQTIEFSKNNLASELQKYKIHVAPYKDRANVVLTLIKEWQYNLKIEQ